MDHRTPEPLTVFLSTLPILTPRKHGIQRPQFLPARSASFHTRAASADGYDKSATKGLVERFYRGGVQSKQSSHTDITDINTLLTGSRTELESPGDKVIFGPGEKGIFGSAGKNDSELPYGLGSSVIGSPIESPKVKINRMPEPEHLKVGYLSYEPVDLHNMCPENISSRLVNIERTQKDMQPAIEAVHETLQALWNCVSQRLHLVSGGHESSDKSQNPLGPSEQLREIEEYLEDLQNNINEMDAELIEMTGDIKARYLGEIKESMEKLRNLEQLVTNLSLRLTAAKNSMALTRHELREKIGAKLELLDDVSARFNEYDRKNRQRRGQQLIGGLSIFVLSLAVGVVFTKWFNVR